jgi:hypothetical protein
MSLRHHIQMQGLRIELGGKALDSLLMDAPPTRPVGLPNREVFQIPPASDGGTPHRMPVSLRTYVPSARLT